MAKAAAGAGAGADKKGKTKKFKKKERKHIPHGVVTVQRVLQQHAGHDR